MGKKKSEVLVRKFLAFTQAVGLLAAQLLTGAALELLTPRASVAQSVNCGLTSIGGSSHDFSVYGFYSPCTTGANSTGYTVSNEQIYTAAVAGKIYGAVYTDSSTSPHTRLCQDTTGTTASPNSWNTSNLSGCGTLAPNTVYWIGTEYDTATTIVYTVGSCGVASTGFYSVTGGTAPHWDNPASALTNFSNCASAYLVLSPVPGANKAPPIF